MYLLQNIYFSENLYLAGKIVRADCIMRHMRRFESSETYKNET